MTAGELRAVIVDDEPAARGGIRAMLEGDPEVRVVGEASHGREAVDVISALTPDVVFLDVQMPELDGFGVVDALSRRAGGTAGMPAIVFVTAYDSFAIRAFQVSAIDYLLKPFDDARFAQALARAKREARRARADDLEQRFRSLLAEVAHITGPAPAETRPSSTAGSERFVVRTGERVTFVPVGDVDWIEAADYCARLHAGGRGYLIRESMNALEERLDANTFFRVSRSAIVQLNRVQELRPQGDGRLVVILRDGTRLPLTRGRRERLGALLGRPV